MKNEIWLLVDSSNFGGIESHLIQFSESCIDKGINARIIFMQDYPGHPLYDELKKRQIPFNTCRGVTDLANQLKHRRPAIIHTHGYKAGIVGRVLGKLLNIACVSTFHAGEKPKGKVFLYDWLDRKLAPLADKVFTVSPQVSARINCKNYQMNNFIRSTKMAVSRGHQIAFVGRLSHEKGPDTFVQLSTLHTNHNFHIYGDGPMRDVITDNHLENVVHHGAKKSMDNSWKDIGILLITSRFEGLPMTAIEAMSRGIPVIAFDQGALSQLIQSGTNGWIVPAGDITGLSETLTHWLAMNDLDRQRIKSQARLTIQENYTSDTVIPQYLSAYNSCLGKEIYRAG